MIFKLAGEIMQLEHQMNGLNIGCLALESIYVVM